jgi:hypothetical protein
MAVILRDTAAVAATSTAVTTTATLTGLDVIPGALLLVIVSSERGALADIRTPTCSDGAFTQIGSGGAETANGDFIRAFYRVITSTTSTNFSVTTTNTTAATSQKTHYASGLVFTNHGGIGNYVFTNNTPINSATTTDASDYLVIASGFENNNADPQIAGMTRHTRVNDASNLGSHAVFGEQLLEPIAGGTRTHNDWVSTSVSIIVKDGPIPARASRDMPFFQ